MNIRLLSLLCGSLIALTALSAVAQSPPRATEEIMDAQRRLTSAGYYYGDIDGLDGPETQAAIKRFQIREGLPVTGRLDDATRSALGGAATQAEAPAPSVSEFRPITQPSATPQPVVPPVPPASQATPASVVPTEADLQALTDADRAFLDSQVGMEVPTDATPTPTPAPTPVVYRGIVIEPPGGKVYRGRLVSP